MKKALLIKVNEEGVPEIQVLDFNTNGDNLGFFYKHVECETFDIVKAMALQDNPVLGDLCMVVDDEGLFKDKPVVNVLGSLLYGFLEHGQMLVGNVLICKDVYTDDGIETGGLDKSDIIALDLALAKLVKKYNDEVVRRNSEYKNGGANG